MAVFNSLGSNYDFKFALKALFPSGKNSLKDLLRRKYKGEVILLFKGREAITLSLKLLKIPKESQVAINGFTCYAVYRAIEEAGLKPVLIDLAKNQLNFDKDELAKTLKKNPNIKAVIIQNTFGIPCDIDEIKRILKKNKIFLIEDLAHSVGSFYKNAKEAGTVGDIIIFSFSQDKIIDSVSGGALIIKNKKISDKNIQYFTKPPLKKILTDRFYPMITFIIRKTYKIKLGKIIHFIFRKLNILSQPMDENLYDMVPLSKWHQRLANIGFENLKKEIYHRRKIANIYASLLNKEILLNSIIDKINISSNLRFPIFIKKRNELVNYLEKYNVYVSDIWYDAPISPKKYLQKIKYKGECPNAEEISSLILNLPTHKNISEEKAKYISEAINKWLELQ